jgi:branched-chain amino acid transport system substrate-binding protein
MIERMKAIPTEDPYFRRGYVPKDGRAIHDMQLLHVKRPEDSHFPWDYASVAQIVAGDDAFRPLAEGGCKMVT